jgi:transposase
VKRHLATDADGTPLAVLVGPANRRDEQPVGPLLWLMRAFLLAAGLRLPAAVQADRGYGFPWTIALVRAWGMVPVIAPRGSPHGSGLGRTRYVVERTHAWFSRFRRLVQCYERRPEHAQGFHTLAACVICARRLRAGRPGRGQAVADLAA